MRTGASAFPSNPFARGNMRREARWLIGQAFGEPPVLSPRRQWVGPSILQIDVGHIRVPSLCYDHPTPADGRI